MRAKNSKWSDRQTVQAEEIRNNDQPHRTTEKTSERHANETARRQGIQKRPASGYHIEEFRKTTRVRATR